MILLLLTLCFSSDSSKYRKCSDSRFCDRNRNVENQKWALNSNSIKNDQNQFEAIINDDTYETKLKLTINFLSCGSIRIRIRPTNTENFLRYDLSKEQTVFNQEEISKNSEYTLKKSKDSETLVGSYNQTIEIINNPLKITLSDHTGTRIVLNPDDSAIFETNRSKDKYPDMFEAISFDYQTDSIPNGPTSVAMSIDFVAPYVRLSGLPSHSLPLTLPQTDQSEDLIRLYNTDPIKFDLNSGMAFHGSVPFILAHSQTGCDGFLWANPSETWIDTKTILNDNADTNPKTTKAVQRSRFISEGGFIDIFLFTGPNGKDILNKYTKLTGKPQLPPLFSLGFHQSRWGYYNKDNLIKVSRTLDDNLIPHDSIWLDMDFEDSNREIFTFNKDSLPNPTRFFNEITKSGRYAIVSIAPGLRASDDNYAIYKEAEKNGYLIRTRFNRTFYANSYSGKTAWPDFLNKKTQFWWASLFKFTSFKHSMSRVFVWNDLNAPTAFEDYELTLPRSVLHDKNYENREVHNVYGHLSSFSTFSGLLKREKNVRPFILSNSFFIGTQKYAILTVAGSPGEWGSLHMSVQNILSLGLAGQIYAGIDIGGSYGKPNKKLLSRWYQVGAWLYPFFRTHCHHLAPAREVYTLKNETKLFEAAREAIVDRYLLLPYWYTLSRHSNLTGEPIVRPIWWDLETSKEFNHYADVDDIAMIGKSLLVVPFLSENESDLVVRFPSSFRWFSYKTLDLVKESKESKREAVLKFDSGKTAVFVKGGSIVPKKLHVRRSSELMINDYFMLLIAVDEKDKAEGDVYIDDGKSFNFLNGNEFIHKSFSFDGKLLSSKNILGAKSENSFASNFVARVEKIVVTGLSKMPKRIHHKNGTEIDFTVENNVVIIDRLNVLIRSDLEIHFEY